MTDERPWIAALVYPAPLYAAVLVFAQVGHGDGTILVGFVLALLFGTATAVGLIQRPLLINTGRSALLLLAVLPIAYSGSAGGPGVDLSVGVILGSPFLWIGYTWQRSSSVGARVVALEGTFLVGILCLAAGNATTFPPGSSPSGQFVAALGSVISGQIRGVAALLTGGTPVSMPLEATLDVAYVALGAVAIVGTLVSGFIPRTALEEPLPWTWTPSRSVPDLDDALAEELGLRPGQREALASRTRPSAPTDALPPGFGSVILAAALVMAFVGLAVAVPSVALLTLVVGVVGAVLAVALVLSRRLTAVGGLEG